MDLYYLNFNNYYNRQLKVKSTLAEYLPFVIGTSEANRNFNPANDIVVKFITNRTRDEVGDYVLAVENGVIKSRWYILNGDRVRGAQYELTVRRDVLADYYASVITAPCFIEKATLDTGDPMIFNKEDMTVNQIKTTETQLKDETGCAWVVGYIPNDAFSTATTIDSQYIRAHFNVDDSFATLQDFPYYYYIDHDLWAKPYYFRIHTYIGYHDSIFRYVKDAVVNLQSGSRSSSNIRRDWSSPCYKLKNNVFEEDFSVANFYALLQPIFGSGNRQALYNSLLGYTKYAQNSTVDLDEVFSWNNKIIQVGTGQNAVYYRINIISAGEDQGVSQYLTATVGADKISPYLNFDQVEGTPNDETFYIENMSKRWRIQLTQLYGKAEVTLSSDRLHLEDSPYDMFCIPYSDDLVIKNNEADFCTANKSLALSIATAIGRESGSANLYDIQLLPYCPVRRAIKPNGDFDIVNEKYNIITNGAEQSPTTLGVVIWCDHSSFTFDIDHSIEVANPKVANQCDMYRLVSPNYSGQFEFNPAMNGGVTKFNVDCAYKPFTPYIHLNPDFGLLYGSDFNDARGLICGGDFSLPQVSDPWANYQLQNKNYQEIFDRQIQNMETGFKYQNLSQLIGGSISAIGTGVTTGVLAGGPFGVLSGIASAVGMGTDYYFNRQLQNEAIDYKKDLFGYELGNIQALPESLTKVSPFNPNNKIFPILEYYTCTETERQAFENKIRWNGMTVMRIGTIQEFIRPTETYIKGKIIRLLEVDEPTNVLNEIANEIDKGVFINGGDTTSN